MIDFDALLEEMHREEKERTAISYTDPHILHGDIWKLAGEYDYVVVTTNIGWKGNRYTPIGVMGRGIALQAAQRYPRFQEYWGVHCERHREFSEVAFWTTMRLVAFPTKPFNPQAPNMSWQNPSTMELCQKSMNELLELIPRLKPGRILLPPIGCGNGGLHRQTVETQIIFPAMEKEPRLYYVQ